MLPRSTDIGNRIAKTSAAFQETNDCTVRALAVCLGGDYVKAHTALKEKGRKEGRGLANYLWAEAYQDLGLRLDDVTDNFDGKSIRAVEKELAELDDDVPYVISVRGHVCAWCPKSKALIDWASGRLHRIDGIYRVCKYDDPPSIVRELLVEEPSNKTDVVFITPGKNDERLRIMIRMNGKVRHLQDKWYRDEAEIAAQRAADKRWINWIGYVTDYKNDLLDHYSQYDFENWC